MPAITVENLKQHLNITTDADDELLAEKIETAESWVRTYCGIPSDGTFAPPAKEATRQLAGHLYENREASLVGVTAQQLPFGVLELLEPYRAWVF